ncbi:AcfA family outer membrane beta-barrel protein [Vibrio sp. 10N.247.311.51]|uniref:AcfA family outer membrane beta-barrel protein n=1 Tax=Vibrio sp. 10N.247.311.51 TaxID=3229996 RepID=UPI003552ED13
MRKMLGLVALFTAPVFSGPYLGLEYGLTYSDHDFEPVINGKQLNPESDGAVLGGFIGYKFENSWAVELGYSQFELDDSYSIETQDASYEYEKDWDADIEAKQFTLIPMYFHDLNEKWSMKGGIGLSYTKYEYGSSYKAEQEEHISGIEQVTDYQKGPTGSSHELGGIASIGIDYTLMSNLTFGASAKYQIDNYANTATFNLMTAYYF